MPSIHMAERRRLVDGTRLLSEIKREQQRQHQAGERAEQARRKQGRKARYRQHYLEQQANGGVA